MQYLIGALTPNTNSLIVGRTDENDTMYRVRHNGDFSEIDVVEYLGNKEHKVHSFRCEDIGRIPVEEDRSQLTDDICRAVFLIAGLDWYGLNVEEDDTI